MRPGGGGGFAFNLVSFGEDSSGELYLVSYDGNLFQIVPEPAGVLLLVVGWLVALRWRSRR